MTIPAERDDNSAMSALEPRVVTVIGAGTIGVSWAALFLARGMRVRVHSRRPDARGAVTGALRLFAPALPGGPAEPDALAQRLEIEPDLERAVAGADVIQENVEEVIGVKRELFARIERLASREALLLSSTSTMLPDDLGADMEDSGRLVVAHPFNPPHIIPLVEIIGGQRTRQQAVEDAVKFCMSAGKSPVVLRKPIAGFAANRLQAALLRESIHLVREGIVTMAELDEVVTQSIGLRWATTGPFLAFHLGGGAGGLAHWLEHLGSGLEEGWKQLGQPAMDDATKRLLIEQADSAYGSRSYERLVTERDERQLSVLSALAAG
jgi:ketoreductase RED1